jgi:hypothetical protein
MNLLGKVLSVALIALLGLGSFATFGWGQAGQDCEAVEGTLNGAFVGPLSTAGTIDSNDKLLQQATTSFQGDGLAASAGLDPSLVPPSTVSYTGLLTITTPEGTLTLRDVGIFDTDVGGGDGEFASRSRVVTGTERFAGATGILFFHGDTAPDFTFSAPFDGQICVTE